jgi:Zn-dependent protease with chaperone function
MIDRTKAGAAHPVAAAWKIPPRAAVEEFSESRLRSYRHGLEWRTLTVIGAVLLAFELAFLLIGPEGRASIEAGLHWVPKGLIGGIMNIFEPGGVVTTLFGFLALTAALDLYNHWLQRAQVLSECVEVTPTTVPALHALFTELTDRFQLSRVRLFLQKSASRPYSLGMAPPFLVVLPVSMLGSLTDDEMRFVLGRELGHIKLGHTHVEPFLGGGDFSAQGILSLLPQIRSLVLAPFHQAQEYSADRLGIVACRGVEPAISAHIKLGLGSPRGAQLDPASLATQAADVHRGHMVVAGTLRQFWSSDPPLFSQLREMMAWAGIPTGSEAPAKDNVASAETRGIPRQ